MKTLRIALEFTLPPKERFAHSREGLLIALVALLCVGCRWILTLHTGLNLADWGYLWYGSWRTRLGEIPLLDFQSYDPGRYYYLAVMSRIVGDGIIGTRESLALIQWVAVTVALRMFRRSGASWFQACCCGVLLAWWMWPNHKIIDSALAIFTSWVANILFSQGQRVEAEQGAQLQEYDNPAVSNALLVAAAAAFFRDNQSLTNQRADVFGPSPYQQSI